jgi:hypothetical protein
VLQQTVNNSAITLRFNRNPGTGADTFPYKVLFLLMFETVEKSIKLVFGTEVRNVTKNHILGYALEKKLRILIRSGISFSFMFGALYVMQI